MCDGCEPTPNASLTPPPVVTIKRGGERGSAPVANRPSPPPAPPAPPGRASPAAPAQVTLQDGQPPVMHAEGFRTFDNATLTSLLLEQANEIRSLRVELAALAYVFVGRGLITEKELNDARMAITTAANRVFAEQTQAMGRQFAQRPTHAGSTQPPHDPRRGPR